ncbi:MAG: DNA-3-methyladenine glycosylase 2 family protein, partial [Burkholderiales bacterium]
TQLRAAGLSAAKASYVRDLSDAVVSGRVVLRQIARKPDEEIIEELIQVKGIGRWTAQMFLIFSLGRLDVLPVDDLGVRVAIRDLYGLVELPDNKTSERVAESWRPYASVASWYCWRSIPLQRAKVATTKTKST